MDAPLLNDDELEVKTVDLGNAHVLYVENKHPLLKVLHQQSISQAFWRLPD